MSTPPLVLSLVSAFLVFYIYRIFSRSKDATQHRLPPGPRGLPILGNINDLPQPGILEAHHWLKHKDIHGPISSVTVMGQTLIIINDASLAFELMEKRSAIHSSRPKQIFAGEMLGWKNSLGLSPYNNHFRTYRKNMARIIGSSSSASQFNDLQEEEAGHFLLKVRDSPDDLQQHIRKEAGSLILKIAYGYNSEPHRSDPLIDMAGDAMDKFAKAGVPGAVLVDIFPFMRFLPDWFPGTAWKQTAKEWGAALLDVTERPYAFTKHQMSQGKHETSFLSRLLEVGAETPEEEWTNKWSAMSLYTAGADTTVSAISSFFLAMTICPEIQRTAQAEIDRVIGSNRLPTIADRENLSYVNALVKEVLRWQPVAPMGLPHTSTEDDVIEGYFIPKDAMLFANVWHFTHDPTIYDCPTDFKPERFLTDPSAPDPHQFVFGFGRRICPGRILADNTLFITIAQSLAVFNIEKAVDANGVEVEPMVKMEPGVVSHPAPYKNSVRIRSEQCGQLLRRVEQRWPWRDSDADMLRQISVG